MITVSNLNFAIGSEVILNDINLTIPKGKVTALIGPNGAGKSTLLSLIARLIPIQTGDISVDDLTIGKTPNDILARKLSILPQASETTPRMSVRDLVSFGRYPYTKGRTTAEDRKKIDHALHTFGFDKMAGRALDTLSGGQKQRALIAMSFAQDTDYMLLDEPLNNLDIAASRNLMRLMRDIAEQHHRTVVIVLHDINYASRYADEIVTLKNGRLGPSGAPKEVINSEMLKSIFDTQTQVHTLNGCPVVEV